MANAQPPGRAAPAEAHAPAGPDLLDAWCSASGALIFLVAFFAVFAVDLPDTSKLYDVKRQPSISYLDRSGALLAVRGSQYAPPVDLDKLPTYVPKAFIAIEDRWFYWHFGFNPWGIARSQIYNMQHRRGRPAARRLDHHPAAGPQPLPDPEPDLSPQGPGADPGGLAGGASSPRSRSSSSI